MNRFHRLFCALMLVTASIAPARGAAQGAAGAGECAVEIPAGAADSLFALARERAGTGAYALVPFTRKPRAIPARGSMNWSALDVQQLERLARGAPMVAVAYELGSDGVPVRVEVVRGSGDERTDRLVADSYRQTRYQPARAGKCPVPYFGVEPFRMRLRTEVRRVPA